MLLASCTDAETLRQRPEADGYANNPEAPSLPAKQRFEPNPFSFTARRAPRRRGSRMGRHARDMKSSAWAGSRASRDVVDVELLKAVAQAWHAQSGNPRPSSRAAANDPAGGGGARARAGAAPRRPSRFKLEAMAAATVAPPDAARARERSWDFAQSLWDPYELVAVARTLESGLVIADHAAAAPREGDARGAAGMPGRESGRSLRNLFLRSTSKRFGFEEPSS